MLIQNSTFRTRPWSLAGCYGDPAGPNFYLAVANADGVLWQSVGRRARGHRAVLIVDPSVARAHEEAGVRQPAYRAAEVRAVDRESCELLLGVAAQPGGSLRGDPCPRQRRGI